MQSEIRAHKAKDRVAEEELRVMCSPEQLAMIVMDGPQKLLDWLERCYFDGELRSDIRREYFGQIEIRKVGKLVKRMLRLEPSARVSTEEVLGDPWFHED